VKTPTSQDLKTARRVLEFYQPKVAALSDKTGQEKPAMWTLGCELWIELLENGPEQEIKEYEQEYDLTHSETV
jgi:hypothetical protein